MAIVASILIAFAIDAWWAERQEMSVRQELVTALHADFEETIVRAEATFAQLDEQQSALHEYRSLVDGDDVEDVSALRDRVYHAVRGALFTPSMSAYQSAVGAGTFALVNNRELSRAMTGYLAGINSFDEFDRISFDMFFLGTGSEIAFKYGDLRVLTSDPATFESRFKLDDSALRDALTSELVYTHCVKAMTVKREKKRNLALIKESLLAAIAALDS